MLREKKKEERNREGKKEREMKVYYIGGSSCSGKTTIARVIAKKHDLSHIELDENLERYVIRGASEGKKYCIEQKNMQVERKWEKSPEVLYEEEIGLYREIFPYVMEDIENLLEAEEIGESSKAEGADILKYREKKAKKEWIDAEKKGFIIEGIGLLPSELKKAGIDLSHYICLTARRQFQEKEYRKREWVSEILKSYEDGEKAFQNWMGAEELFAKEIERQARKEGCHLILNDGTCSIEQLEKKIQVRGKYLS